ncbi:hypothetical protein GYMLUDRAFT_278627 [Collybiopsis luxurians FD-317 M1]|nr:hypothetical protein GYMLUDRAFT_278627 [Collybiopsis luxurians FD-317 M1]
MLAMQPNGGSPSTSLMRNTPTSSSMHRHSRRPPLRSSPLTGPALSRDGLIVEDDGVQGRPKPSRISSTPNLPSVSFNDTIYTVEPIPPLPFSHSGIFMKSQLNQRKSSPPGYLTVTPATLDKPPSPPSFQMPITPPPSPPRVSSRPPSRESAKSLPIPTHTISPPNFPRALHRNSSPALNNGAWLTKNTYGEIPHFSRLSVGSSKVVMPLSAKEYRRRSLVSAKSNPNLRHQSMLPTSIGASSKDSDAIKASKRISSFTRRMSKIVISSLDTLERQGSHPHSECASEDESDFASFVASFPSPPSARSPHSRSSSSSSCARIGEEGETDTKLPFYPLTAAPRAVGEAFSAHQRTPSEASSKSGGFSASSRSSSFASLTSRTKNALKKSKSLVLSRKPSNTTSASGTSGFTSATTSPRHAKGLSFLSFASTEDLDVPPVPALPDNLSTSSSSNSDTASMVDETQIEARQLLHDALPPLLPLSSPGGGRALDRSALLLPSHTCSSTEVNTTSPMPGMMAPPIQSRTHFDNEEPDQILDPELIRADDSFVSSVKLFSSLPPIDALPISPSPSNIQAANSSDVGKEELSNICYPSAPSTVDTMIFPSCTKSTSLMSFGDTPVIPPRSIMADSSKAMSLLGIGSPGMIVHNQSDIHLETRYSFSASKGTQKYSGAIRKFWSNLTGRKEVGKIVWA